MISTKINVDTSGILKAFDMVDKEGKVSADYLKKVFSDNIVIEVNDNEIKNLPKQAKKSFDEIDNEAKGLFANLKSSLNLGSILNFASGQIVADGIAKVGEGLGFLAEQASRADEIGTQLENGFRLAGLSGAELDKQLQETTKFARDFGFELGVAPERIKELSATAGALGGATGKMNKDLSKLAVGVEMATNGAIKGEQAIKIFSRGIADPENAEAIDKLKKSFPQLGEALLSANDPAGKLQAGLNALSGTFETMKNDTSDVEARFGIFKMQIAEGAQAIGGAFLSSFNTDKLLEFFGSMGGGVDIFKVLENAGTILGQTLTNALNVMIDIANRIMSSPVFQFLANNIELVVTALISYIAYQKAMTVELTTAELKTKAIATAQAIYNGVMAFGNTVISTAKAVMLAFSNGTVIATAKTYLMTTAQTLLNAIMSANPIGLVVVALGALTAGLVYAYKNSEAFRKIIDGIWETMKGWLKSLGMIVTKVLEFFGILGKDVKVKATKEIEKDTKAIETNITNTNLELDKQSTKVEKNVKAVKTLQQQYDELYNATVKLSQENNRGLQYEKNIKQLEVLKGKLKDLETNKALVDFRLADNKVEIPDMVLDSFKNEIDTYFEKEKVTLSIAKVEVKTDAIKPIEESETDKMFKNLAKSLTDGFSKIDYTSIFKKKETAFDESLNEDRANLLTSLQQNEISYEEYSERLNEIDRNRRETQKEGNSEFIQGLNQTLAVSLENTSNLINESITKSMTLLSEVSYKSDDFTSQLNSNIETALVGIGTMTAEMALNGQNLMKSLLMNVIKTAQIMFNAYAAPLLLKSNLERPFGLGTPEWIALMVLGNATLGLAQSALAGFKDGVINLQGAGTSTSDSIPAMLSKGESVINARSTAQNEPYLRFINNGGDMSKLVNMNMNTKNIENLLYTNNELLRSKNLISNVNVNNKFEVANSGINVKIKR